MSIANSQNSDAWRKPMGISKSKIIGWCIAVVILIIMGFAGYTWITLNWSFSKGKRAGYVQKFSQKGWICKTWEGELQMMPVPGAIPEKFLFSVRNDAIAQQINNAMGKKIDLLYEQHKGVPTTCFGETEYYVTDIKVLE
jgi:hypothetical protein